MRWIPLFFLGSLFFAFGSCESSSGQRGEEDRLLAKVYSKALYLSDLEGMIPEGAPSEDSSLIIDAFRERWIRETLILQEAEKNIPQDLNIDKLVRDYRASLVRNNYEQKLVEQLLDSTIAKKELTDFYEKNKAQYNLEVPVVQCYFLKIPRSSPDIPKVRQYWANSKNDANAYGKLVEYANMYADAHLLEDSIWYRVDQITVELPPNKLTNTNVTARREFIEQDNNYIYFFKAFQIVTANNLAPFGYVENQIRKVILRQRRTKLLEEKKEDMYDREIRRNNIEVYND